MAQGGNRAKMRSIDSIFLIAGWLTEPMTIRVILPPLCQLAPLYLPETEVTQRTPAPRLVAVVTTHNRLAQLRRTVTRLLETPDHALHGLVVVDNASDDGTLAWLASQRDPRLHVLRLDVNSGGAGGFATGLKYARRLLDPDWALLMDDDARPMPGVLEAFHASDLGSWDAIAGAAYRPEGQVCECNFPMRDPFASLRVFLRTALFGRKGFHLDATDYAGTEVISVDAATFVGLFLSRRALCLGGLPDRRLFIYGDDILQTLRLSRAGGRIGFNPALHFEHDTTGPGGGVNAMPLWKIYYRYRNSLIIYREAAGWFFPVVCMIVVPRWAFGARGYKGQRRAYFGVLARAVWHGLRRQTAIAHDMVLLWARTRPEPVPRPERRDMPRLSVIPSSEDH